jgi:hypothetical protein
MYKNRSLVRDVGIRVYVNEMELQEIEEGALLANGERASFMRDASLVVARYIKRMHQQGRTSKAALVDLQARLSSDFRYSLA